MHLPPPHHSRHHSLCLCVLYLVRRCLTDEPRPNSYPFLSLPASHPVTLTVLHHSEPCASVTSQRHALSRDTSILFCNTPLYLVLQHTSSVLFPPLSLLQDPGPNSWNRAPHRQLTGRRRRFLAHIPSHCHSSSRSSWAAGV